VKTPLNPDVEPLAVLLGTWSGSGHGEYPTIDDFDYEETIEFSHVGKPFLSYSQVSKHAVDGHPLHGESGFWRMANPGWVELVVSHPNGIVEVAEGTFRDATILLRSTCVALTRTAKEVTAIERDFTIEREVLRYSLRMTAVGQPLSHHPTAQIATHRIIRSGTPIRWRTGLFRGVKVQDCGVTRTPLLHSERRPSEGSRVWSLPLDVACEWRIKWLTR
jgi:hypothetical protein